MVEFDCPRHHGKANEINRQPYDAIMRDLPRNQLVRGWLVTLALSAPMSADERTTESKSLNGWEAPSKNCRIRIALYIVPFPNRSSRLAHSPDLLLFPSLCVLNALRAVP